MLASISPLGERARGNRWTLTAVAYGVGTTAGGAAVGGLLAAGGLLLPSPGHRIWIVSAAGLAAGAWDLLWPGRLPTLRRQVDEDWLQRYRGWVYGLGFGLQLGAGLATVVTTATVFAWMLVALLAKGVAAGTMMGAAFGAARAAEILAVRDVHDPARLRQRLRLLSSWAGPARVGAAAASVAVGAGCAASVLGGVR